MAKGKVKSKKKVSAIDKLKKQLEWYENFASYVEYSSRRIHEEACEFADEQEK